MSKHTERLVTELELAIKLLDSQPLPEDYATYLRQFISILEVELIGHEIEERDAKFGLRLIKKAV